MGAKNTAELRTPNPWEYLGTFFGYFAVVKDVPDVFRLLFGLEKGEWFADQWIAVGFSIWVAGSALWFLWRRHAEEKVNPDEPEDLTVTFARQVRKQQAIRIIRSLGLVWVQEQALDRMGVARYHTFDRPPPPMWKSEPERSDMVVRFVFKTGHGVEYQFPRAFDGVYVRSHAGPAQPGDIPSYGETVKRPPTGRDVRLLLAASPWRFGGWYVVYFLKAAWRWVRARLRSGP